MKSRVVHTPLDKDTGQIRILLLQPGTFHRPIRCSLSIESVQSRFEALSYVWGDVNDTLPIEVLGQEFRVTRNLESALRHLRDSDQIRRLWVDAICIDQNDNLERSHQVAMMDMIYSRAERVIAWLGLELSEMPALLMVKNFSRDLSLHWDPKKRANSDTNIVAPLFELLKWLQNTWYNRMWTLQEALLAKSLIYMSGPFVFQHGEIEGVLKSYHRHMHRCCSLSRTTGTEQIANIHNDLIASSQRAHSITLLRQQSHQLGFLEIAPRFRYREAKNPRDKVFGVLGLTDDIPKDIIDYEKSVTDIYSLATVECIRRTGNLDILSHILSRLQSTSEYGPEKIEYGLPSWVPDWNSRRPSDTWRLDELSKRQKLTKVFSASHTNSTAYPEALNQNRLCLQGFFCDHVAKYGEVKESGPGVKKMEVFHNWRELVKVDQEPEKPYISGSTVFDAYWRTICMNIACPMPSSDQPRKADEVTRLSHDYWWWITLLRTKYSHLSNRGNIEEKNLLAWGKFSTHLAIRLSGRKLFISKNGYIGLAPEDALEGDEIWVLDGGRLPLVLRPLGNRSEKGSETEYTLVGDSYVHGIMDGEFVEASMKRGETPRPVILV
ncbi:hypothetical protein Daesc_001665 [Daldinia eschscholtzii]|uniref:Heterokaryon incompatibility domain-containing protein n=1 Tax=Daldinia eschscholtzii TaxID=292717 RepID=A0AAX6MUS0_9PEZI